MTGAADRLAARRARLSALLGRARRAPHAQDFYALARALENADPSLPRLGSALRPADEPVRFGQDIGLRFAPAAISSVGDSPGGRALRVGIEFMGLFGPNGPMPLHLTEYAFERRLQEADPTFADFADIFHHRMISLLYRAWAQAQAAIGLDRDDAASFDFYVDALYGNAGPGGQRRDSIRDAAKRRYCSLLGHAVKTAEGLRDILADYLRVPVAVESFVGHWMPMQERDRTRLGQGTAAARLGAGAVLGAALWDRQNKFRVRVGPLAWSQYRHFLPGGSGCTVIRDWVRQYVGLDLAWDLAVSLQTAEYPEARLGGVTQVGLSTWIGRPQAAVRPQVLVYEPESWRAPALDPGSTLNPAPALNPM
jgi:type VI secretion system protein ImpH